MKVPGISHSRLAVLAWVSVWALGGIATVRRAQTAMVRLQRAPDLSFFGLNGFSREATDFQWMLRLPGAESRFSRLASEGSSAGKVFGACGLYLVQSDRFEAARARLSSDGTELSMGGCTQYSKSVRELAADLPRICPHLRMESTQWAIAEIGWLTGR